MTSEIKENYNLNSLRRIRSLARKINNLRHDKKIPLRDSLKRLHRDVNKETVKFIPSDVRLETKVYEMPLNVPYCSLGGLIKSKDKWSIFIDEKVAELGSNSIDFKLFLRANEGKASPEDLFKNILSHEYGHILFRELKNRFYSPSLDSKKLIGLSEGFAFWFGDTISGKRMPLKSLAKEYRDRGNPQTIIRSYNLLRRSASLIGSRETVEIAVDILYQMDYRKVSK
ncbi:MAG: hypothetical protein AABX95_03820 [Nanoarchaeota archaeon]